MYDILGISYKDKLARLKEVTKNFKFFDAPMGLIFTIDETMQPGQFVDLGLFMQNIMLLSQKYGLNTCAQGFFGLCFLIPCPPPPFPCTRTHTHATHSQLFHLSWHFFFDWHFVFVSLHFF